MLRLISTTVATAVAAVFAMVVTPANGQVPATAAAPAGAFVECADYDGLSALGSPLETVGGVPEAGTVRIRHVQGTVAPQTVTATGVGLPLGSDRFGFATTTTALNSTDQCNDVVVGVPLAGGGAGRVVVIPGSGDGLALDRALVLDASSVGITAGDNLGWAVSTLRTDAGVFVVAGAPNHDGPSAPDAGALVTWLIPTGGIPGTIPTPSAPTLWMQGSGGLLGTADPGDHFGSVIAQPSQTARHDLTVGIPDEDVGGKVDTGAVAQLSIVSTSLASNKLIWQGSGMPGKSKKGDRFGAAVAAPYGRIEAIGIPGKDANGRKDSGAVIVRTPADTYKVITQNTKGVPDKSEKYDAFGSALGGLFGLRGVEVVTVAVGVPGEDRSGKKNVGAVTFIDNGEVLKLTYGSQKTSGLPKRARFGQRIVVVGGDLAYDEDMRDILIIGAPGSAPTGTGTYWRGLSTGIQPWETGLYFATQ